MPSKWDQEKCLREASYICDVLNDGVYQSEAEKLGVPARDNLWEIEVEAYMRRFFQAGKKKRYAYLATWKDGHEIDEPEPSISGFSSKRSDSSQLTEETEEHILHEILHGNEDTVGTIVYEAAQEIERRNPDWERIGIPGGMNNKIDRERSEQDGYYAFNPNGYPQDAHPRAVWNSNKILNLGLDAGDKPMRVYIEEYGFEELGRAADVLAFEQPSDMQPVADEVFVDVPRMTETLLIRPLNEICDAIGVDVSAAVWGQTQTGLGAFEDS